MVLVAISLSAYAAFALLVYLGQRRILFPAPVRGQTPVMEDTKLTEIVSASGRKVHALYAAAPPGAVTVVHFHGNGEELADVVPLAWSFRRAGVGFYAVEYPGYGLSRDYVPAEDALYADSEAALWHLTNGLGVPTSEVVLQGQSLGAGVAVEMAKRGHGARLILISPFTSVPDMAAAMVPLLPVRFLVHDRFANLDKARSLTLPVLVVHGVDDEVVPFEMGERLSRAFPNATLYKVQGGHHNDLFVKDGRIIVDRIAEFAKGEYGGR